MRCKSCESVGFIACCTMLLLMAFALPQMYRPFWHDEVATLDLFASAGPFYPFTDYHLPNNHMLSSAVLAVMRPVSESPLWLRLWPLSTTLAACGMLVLLARWLGGVVAAWLAGMTFACSGITQAFALQLRGYAPSWPCLLLAALAVTAYAQRRWRKLPAMSVFAAASLASLALLPTNLPWLLMLAAIAAWLAPEEKGVADPYRSLWRLLWLALPAIGLIAYAGVFAQFVSASQQSWHNPDGRWQILAEIYSDMAQDVVLLLPLTLIGAVLTWRGHVQGKSRVAAAHVAVLTAVLLAPLPFWLLSPSPPFSRAVVPWWPLIILALVLIATPALRLIGSRWGAVVAAMLLVMIATAGAREVVGWQPWPPRQAQNVMHQTLLLHYYRAGYRPDVAAKVIATWLRDPNAQVISDSSDFPSLRWHLTRLDPGLLSRLHFLSSDTEQASLRGWLASRSVYFVTASEEQTCRMLAQAGQECAGRFDKIADTGFFKGYRIHPASTAQR